MTLFDYKLEDFLERIFYISTLNEYHNIFLIEFICNNITYNNINGKYIYN